MSDRLSAFNRKLNQHYWQVKEVEAPHDGLPCFTREEMRNFEQTRADESRLAFKMRFDWPGVEIAWPSDWRMFRIAEEAAAPDREGAARAAEILAMLKRRST